MEVCLGFGVWSNFTTSFYDVTERIFLGEMHLSKKNMVLKNMVCPYISRKAKTSSFITNTVSVVYRDSYWTSVNYVRN